MDSFSKQHGKHNNDHDQCLTRNLRRTICECNVPYKLVGKQIAYGHFDFPLENVEYCMKRKEKVTSI